MSELRFDRDGHRRDEAFGRQLLAMHGVRRPLECVTNRDHSEWRVSMAVTSSGLLRALRELIAALDRRVPQPDRASELSIARDSAALKAGATKRIEELERAPSGGKS
jgi:hypothetical protein